MNIIFPIITFPYVARILAPEGIGKVNFSLSVIQYFVLIAQFGIPMYAIRICAKNRYDREKLTKTVQEILLINILMIIFSYILFIIIVNLSEPLHKYKTLLFISSIKIFSTSIGVEWFYQAIEDYKYITKRSFIIKIISMVLIFVLINQEKDYLIYALITSFSISIGYFYNFIHMNKYVDIFKIYRNYNFKQHLKPILVLFAMSISVSIYLNLDKVMLGIITNDSAVGLYTAANKMIKVILALVTSLGAVLLPRMSYYIELGKKSQINTLIRKSLDFILMISIPATVGIFMLSEQIIIIFSGNMYVNAIPTMKILSPVILAIGLSNLIGVQILISHGKERVTLLSTIIGAVINFSLNLLLIPLLKQNGAAIGTLVAEISVTIVQLIFAYSYIKGNIAWKNIFTYSVGGILIILTVIIIETCVTGILLSTIISIILSSTVYFIFLYYLNNELIKEVITKVIKGLKKQSGN
jgi:O-antigen/teichoic acid export membrane protein